MQPQLYKTKEFKKPGKQSLKIMHSSLQWENDSSKTDNVKKLARVKAAINSMQDASTSILTKHARDCNKCSSGSPSNATTTIGLSLDFGVGMHMVTQPEFRVQLSTRTTSLFYLLLEIRECYIAES